MYIRQPQGFKWGTELKYLLQEFQPKQDLKFFRSDRDNFFHGEGGSASFAAEINLSEADLPYEDRRIEGEGLTCRTVEGEILQLPLARLAKMLKYFFFNSNVTICFRRVHQSDSLRLASSGATVIQVSENSHQLQERHLQVDRQV